MIGQKGILNKLEQEELSNCLLLVGEEHSGKKELAKEIAKEKGLMYIIGGKGVDELRDLIHTAYQNKIDSIYIIPDIDKVSTNSKNSLLKVIEEPPKHAKFILTANSVWGVLPTILSRSDVLKLEKYTKKDLIKFIKKENISKKDEDLICSVCETPGQISLLMQYDFNKFYDFAVTVIDYIDTANLANAYKIVNSLKLKDEETDKYDIGLFLNIINSFCLIKIKETGDEKYLHFIRITNKCKRALNITGANKKHCLENWVLGMNEVGE